ncbi:hypothetical protein HMPREF1141_0450 [Clostridium sp. MSTE9]|nr:hypothetical protein HMPREF1141_0450 [Clostridium sp. MSTE9]
MLKKAILSILILITLFLAVFISYSKWYSTNICIHYGSI